MDGVGCPGCADTLNSAQLDHTLTRRAPALGADYQPDVVSRGFCDANVIPAVNADNTA